MAVESPAAAPSPATGLGAPWPPVPPKASAWLICLWGILGFVLVMWVNNTPRLPGPHADSLSYMEAARAIASGKPPETTFVGWDAEADIVRLSHFPPGTSILFAIPVSLGLDPVAAATAVMAISAGVLLTLLALMGGWTAGSVGAVVVPAVLLFSPELVKLYVGVWSEPVFLALAGLAALTMWRAPGRPWIYGLFTAAALSVRYAGVPLVGLAILVAVRHAPERGRVKAAALAGGPSGLFLGAWSLWSSGGGGAVRSTGLYAEGFSLQLNQALGALSAWGWSGTAAPLGGLLIIASGVLVARKVSGSSAWPWMAPLTFAGLYFGFIALSRLVADPHIPFDARLFAPLMVGWVALLGAQLARAMVAQRSWRVPAALFIALWVGSGAKEVRSGLRSVRSQGLHYSSTHWDASPIFDGLAERAGSRTLYSNEPELLLFRTGARARRLPRAGAPYDRQELAIRLNQPGALVVLIPPLRRGELTLEELVGQTALRVEISSPQGWLLARPEAPSPIQ